MLTKKKHTTKHKQYLAAKDSQNLESFDKNNKHAVLPCQKCLGPAGLCRCQNDDFENDLEMAALDSEYKKNGKVKVK